MQVRGGEIFANGSQAALFAMWIARFAYVSAVQYEPVVCRGYYLVWQVACQGFLYGQWCRTAFADQAYAVAHAEYVGVHCHLGLLEDDGLYHVCRLAPYAGQALQLRGQRDGARIQREAREEDRIQDRQAAGAVEDLLGQDTGMGYRITAIAAAAVCVLGGVLFMLYNEKKIYAKIMK